MKTRLAEDLDSESEQLLVDIWHLANCFRPTSSRRRAQRILSAIRKEIKTQIHDVAALEVSDAAWLRRTVHGTRNGIRTALLPCKSGKTR